jgi:glycosyltransferase involved in cell wall biosynthesis
MESLRILLVINSLPLPFGTADARWYYVLLKELVAKGHHVTAFVVAHKREDIAKAQDLFPSPKYDLRYYPIPQAKSGIIAKLETLKQPYSYVFSPQLRQDLAAELTKPYDIVHLEQLWTGWLGLEYPEKVVINVHYLFSLDRTFEQNRHWETQLRRFFTDRSEKKLLKTFRRIITLSDPLAERISQTNPQAHVYKIPLGIDYSLYPFMEERAANLQPIIGLIGGFDWTPSYDAGARLLTRLWPEIKRIIPETKLQIIGRSARSAFSAFTHMDDVEIYQDVPDTLPYFAKLDVMLYAPTAGSGMKVKVMEAFALGTPVVTTVCGMEGIPAIDGVHAGICEDDPGLIARTVELLNNPELQNQRRLKARDLLEQHCSSSVTVKQVEQVYKDCLLE